MNQSDFAQAMGVAPQNVHNWTKRGMPPEHNAAAARVTQRSVDALLGLSPDTRPTALTAQEPPPTYNADNILLIDVLDVAGSMGGGELQENENVIQQIAIGLEWVSKHLYGVSNPRNLRVISGRGTSMEPTYSDGAILIVDIEDKTVRDNQVYVLSSDSRVFIKRVHQRVDGRFEISSDNPTAKTVEALNGDHEVTVHGRIVWAWNGRKI